MMYGIDIGTCNTSISFYDSDNNDFKIITDIYGNKTIPSCIYFKSIHEKDILFGYDAFDIKPDFSSSTIVSMPFR
jgi:molecular chaperone DnaK (HSP70)